MTLGDCQIEDCVNVYIDDKTFTVLVLRHSLSGSRQYQTLTSRFTTSLILDYPNKNNCVQDFYSHRLVTPITDERIIKTLKRQAIKLGLINQLKENVNTPFGEVTIVKV